MFPCIGLPDKKAAIVTPDTNKQHFFQKEEVGNFLEISLPHSGKPCQRLQNHLQSTLLAVGPHIRSHLITVTHLSHFSPHTAYMFEQAPSFNLFK